MTRIALGAALSLLVVSTAYAQEDAPPTDPDAQQTDEPSPGYLARVRLTYYTEAGLTYSGGHTYPGSTACSWNFPIGTRFQFADGEVVTCNDRGRLGYGQPVGWLDLWRRPDLARAYGAYATVEVIP